MKRPVAVVTGVLAIVLCFALSSNTQQKPIVPDGTFQLVPAQYTVSAVTGTWEQHTVFLLDSKTGHVWEYLPAGNHGHDGKFTDASLVPVVKHDLY